MQAPAWLSAYALGTPGITPPQNSGSSMRAGIEGRSSGNAVVLTREDASTSSATTHGPAELRREPEERADAARAQARPSTTHGELCADSSFLKSLAHRHKKGIQVGMLRISLGMLSILPSVIVKDLVGQQALSGYAGPTLDTSAVTAYAQTMHTHRRRSLATILEMVCEEALKSYNGRRALHGKSLRKNLNDPQETPGHPFHCAIMEALSLMQNKDGIADFQAKATRASVRRLIFAIEDTMDPWTDPVLDKDHTKEALTELFRAYRPDNKMVMPVDIKTMQHLAEVLWRVRQAAHP